ncbi:MAG: amidohydrolase family protein [Clostridia bacterium]|nr:amidohydrolase family protein [Clostridia bacterium]MBO7250653.1 amidohydrolase family protein [Clostridia bacterium]
MKAIINTNIVMADHMIPNGAIVMDGDRIVDFGKNIKVGAAECIDAKGMFTGPGLIDIHTHAGNNVFFSDDPVTASRALLESGVTDVLPTLYFSMNESQLIKAAGVIQKAKDSGAADNILGFYMEAPYMNPKFGCDRENNPWKGDIRREDYKRLLEEIGDKVYVWGVAPERENIEMFMKDAKLANPKCVFSVAHSEADPYQVQKVMPYGLKLATHHTNATGTLNKYPEVRGVCVDEAVWYNDEIYAELICDKVGIHVDPYMLRLVKKIKGEDKIILISDAYVSDGPVPPGYDGVDDIGFDHSGEIAGSKIFLANACRNMMYHTGASLCQVFKFAAINPAKMLGLEDRGEIGVGKIANLIVTDALFDVKHVFLKGNQIK